MRQAHRRITARSRARCARCEIRGLHYVRAKRMRIRTASDCQPAGGLVFRNNRENNLPAIRARLCISMRFATAACICVANCNLNSIIHKALWCCCNALCLLIRTRAEIVDLFCICITRTRKKRLDLLISFFFFSLQPCYANPVAVMLV